MFTLNLLTATALAIRVVLAREAMYLANCMDVDPNIGELSAMWYFEDDSVVGSSASPDQAAYFELSPPAWIKWEGESHTGDFETDGVAPFTSRIDADAQSQASGALVGTGSGFDGSQAWDCYKDDGETIGSAGLTICNGIYYCHKQ